MAISQNNLDEYLIKKLGGAENCSKTVKTMPTHDKVSLLIYFRPEIFGYSSSSVYSYLDWYNGILNEDSEYDDLNIEPAGLKLKNWGCRPDVLHLYSKENITLEEINKGKYRIKDLSNCHLTIVEVKSHRSKNNLLERLEKYLFFSHRLGIQNTGIYAVFYKEIKERIKCWKKKMFSTLDKRSYINFETHTKI